MTPPNPNRDLTLGSLFSGYGGLDEGVIAAILRTINVVERVVHSWFVEFAPAPSKILAYHFPDVHNYGDITKIHWATVPRVRIMTGGFPCQDVSTAGLRAGLREGTRSGLWSHFAVGIDALRPDLVIIENVRGLLSAPAGSEQEWTDEEISDLESATGDLGELSRSDRPVLRAIGAVLGDLADIGYDAQWLGLRASDVGAPHGRYRIFIVAFPRVKTPHASSDGWPEGGGVTLVDDGSSSDGRSRESFGARALRAPVTTGRGDSSHPVNIERPGAGGSRGGRAKSPDRSDALTPDTARIGLERNVAGGRDQEVLDADARGRFATADTDHTGRGEHAERGLVSVRPEHSASERGGGLIADADRGECDGRERDSERGSVRRFATSGRSEFACACRPAEHEPETCEAETARGSQPAQLWARGYFGAARAAVAHLNLAERRATPDAVDVELARERDEWSGRDAPTRGGDVTPTDTDSAEQERERGSRGVASASGSSEGIVGRGKRVRDAPSHSSSTHSDPGSTGIDWGEYTDAIARWDAILGRLAPHPTLPDGNHGQHRLNPRLVEWMMGAQDGWVTDPAIGITRNQILTALGNGVVPQQAFAAVVVLLRALPDVVRRLFGSEVS